MKRIITLIGLTLGLSGGVAAADSRIHHGPVINHGPVISRGHGPVVVAHRDWSYRGPVYRAPVRESVIRYTDVRYRPAARYERFETRMGFEWIPGQWTWTGYEWTWIGGHYVRC